MQLYRFSPIESKEQLLKAIEHIHFSCFALCKQMFNDYLPVAGNIGVFCHYDDEFKFLQKLRQEMTEPSEEPKQKYFKLREPIYIAAKDGVPETVYTHLYIRKPDIYRAQVGDIDFVIEEEKYRELKTSLQDGAIITGARIFDRSDLDMVELYNPDIDALGYVSPREMAEKGRVKLT
jgi:hypothetical protein